jgi:hypothetical protein
MRRTAWLSNPRYVVLSIHLKFHVNLSGDCGSLRDQGFSRVPYLTILVAPKQSEPEFRRRQDGFIAPPCLDARTIGAYHESGHALVATTLGPKVQRLSVNPDGTGLCRVAQLPTTQNRETLRNYCAVSCAGSIAASKLTGQNRWSLGDHQNVERALGEVGIREAVAIMHEARKLAARIIDENWDSVCSLGRRLRQRGEMDGAEVADFLSGLRAAA